MNPLQHVGDLERLFDPENLYSIWVLGAIIFAFFISWVAARLVDTSKRRSEAIAETQRKLLVEHGTLVGGGGEGYDLPDVPRGGCCRRFRAFLPWFWSEWKENMRTEHPWLSLWLVTLEENIEMSRPQRLAVFLAELLAAMIAAAILYGEQPQRMETTIITGVISSLFMCVAHVRLLLCVHCSPRRFTGCPLSSCSLDCFCTSVSQARIYCLHVTFGDTLVPHQLQTITRRSLPRRGVK